MASVGSEQQLLLLYRCSARASWIANANVLSNLAKVLKRGCRVRPDGSFSDAIDDGPAFADPRHVRERLGAGRRAIQFMIAVVLTGVGLWLLYRNLVYGDVVSGPIVAVAAMMIGSGTLLLPPAILGRTDW